MKFDFRSLAKCIFKNLNLGVAVVIAVVVLKIGCNYLIRKSRDNMISIIYKSPL